MTTTMMMQRFIYAIKTQSKETLRAWSYQCESIFAQRSRRIQQLITFYRSMYGTQGLQQLWRAYYRRDLQPPLHGFMLSAVGILGVSLRHVNGDDFDWNKERLSLRNFDSCSRDLEFLNTLSTNKLCERCKAKKMKYCYCVLGNKKCAAKSGAEPSMRGCQRNLQLEMGAPEGTVKIQAAEEHKWEPYFSKNEFSIWRREERSSMYSYKVYARFDDITAEDFLHVQTDIHYRRQWDDTAVRLEMISEDPVNNTNSHLIYWEMQWPRLFANRDYVYARRYVKDEHGKVIFIASRSAKHRRYPAFAGKVRVNDYWSLMVIKPFRNFHEPGLHFVLTYFDDPGIPIPQNIKSWVAQKQMPDFLTKMYMATKNYACARAMDMRDMFNNFTLINDEYTANASRGTWIGTLQDHRRDITTQEGKDER